MLLAHFVHEENGLWCLHFCVSAGFKLSVANTPGSCVSAVSSRALLCRATPAAGSSGCGSWSLAAHPRGSGSSGTLRDFTALLWDTGRQ